MPEARLTKQQLDAILEEVSSFQVNLEPDPTLPSLGTRYLQEVLAACRNFQNRTNSYLQSVRKHERQLKMELRMSEIDIEKKSAQLLADDPVVRKGPSLEDRKAIMRMMLTDEHEVLTNLQIDLADTIETYKIIKQVYDHLRATGADIKMQRTMVRDDKLSLLGGDGEGSDGKRPDKSLPGGLPPLATAPLPQVEDIMDPARRPDDLPAPVDAVHARMMQDFLASQAPAPKSAPTPAAPTPAPEAPSVRPSISYDDLID